MLRKKFEDLSEAQIEAVIVKNAGKSWEQIVKALKIEKIAWKDADRKQRIKRLLLLRRLHVIWDEICEFFFIDKANKSTIYQYAKRNGLIESRNQIKEKKILSEMDAIRRQQRETKKQNEEMKKLLVQATKAGFVVNNPILTQTSTKKNDDVPDKPTNIPTGKSPTSEVPPPPPPPPMDLMTATNPKALAHQAKMQLTMLKPPPEGSIKRTGIAETRLD